MQCTPSRQDRQHACTRLRMHVVCRPSLNTETEEWANDYSAFDWLSVGRQTDWKFMINTGDSYYGCADGWWHCIWDTNALNLLFSCVCEKAWWRVEGRQLRQIKKLRVKLINNYYAFRCFAEIRPILLPTYCKFKVSCYLVNLMLEMRINSLWVFIVFALMCFFSVWGPYCA